MSDTTGELQMTSIEPEQRTTEVISERARDYLDLDSLFTPEELKKLLPAD